MNKFTGDYKVVSSDEKKVVFQVGGISLDTNFEDTQIYFSGLRINSKFLYPDTEVNVNFDAKPIIVDIKPLSSFYLFTVHKLETYKNKLYFMGRSNFDQSKKKLSASKIFYQDTNNEIAPEVFNKLIGQVIVVKKLDKSTPKLIKCNKSIKILLNNEMMIKDAPDNTYFTVDDLGNGTITSVNFALLNIASNSGKHWVFIADFYNANKIAIKTDPSTFIGKQVKIQIFTYFKRLLVTLITEKPKSEIKLSQVQFDTADFNDSSEQTLNYDKSKNKERCFLMSLINQEAVIPTELSKYSISPQIFNTSLGSVIGLALFEQLFRFKSDTHFIEFFESSLKNLGVFNIYNDWSGQTNFNTFRDLHSFFENGQLKELKRIGEAYISVITHDVESLEAMQELCNLTGFCIHFHDFTERFMQLKIVPIVCTLKKRPIIKLGRYFNDYFLIYSPDEMEIDQYGLSLQVQNLNKRIDYGKKCFPHYDSQESHVNAYLDEFLDSITIKINQNLNNYLAKIKQTQEITVDYNLSKEILSLRSSLLKEDIHIDKQIVEEFNKIDFSQVLYSMPTIKYLCGCCLENLIENLHPKYTGDKLCNHDFCHNHVINLSSLICLICKHKYNQEIQFKGQY